MFEQNSPLHTLNMTISSLTVKFLCRSSINTKLTNTNSIFRPNTLCKRSQVRCISDDNKNVNGIVDRGSKEEEDPFGLHYKDSESNLDGEGNIGPKDDLPPNYIRDATTGKFTGMIQKELSQEEEDLLKMSPLAKQHLLARNFKEIDDTELKNASRKIREQKFAFNSLGRKVSDVSQAIESSTENPNEPSLPLTEDEYESLGRFMKQSRGNAAQNKEVDNLLREAKSEELIPVVRKSSSKYSNKSDETNPDLDLEWTSLAAQRSIGGDVDDGDLEDVFANLMPSDLNPAKKVNRKSAKLIPKDLLHHNNLALLRRYVTPGGQIMNRTQSRLGAKDQRKVAKLIKRARHLGLIPVIGQWKVEDNGDLKEDDLLQNREWEDELVKRGLIEADNSAYSKTQSNNSTSNLW